jgi:hypothetical protein
MFFLSLAAIILVLTVSSLMSLDQLILGSELNGDGSVEYLCLGRGCDGLTYLDW